MKPTIFLSIDSRDSFNPVQRVLAQVVTSFGAQIVDQLVNGESEAQIGVTNSVADALRMVKETEQTTILVCYLYSSEKESAQAFAARFPGRIFAVSFIGTSEEESGVVPQILKLIAEKSKGDQP